MYEVFSNVERYVTGISPCNFSLRQDPTNMAELFSKLIHESPSMLLNLMLLVVEHS
jgi:hypothetical protein